MLKKYMAFIAFCFAVLILGVILSNPVKFKIYAVGGKPPFLIALTLLFMSIASTVGSGYLSYLFWFDVPKAREKAKSFTERFPFYNPTFIFWYVRICYPIMTLFLFGLVLLMFTAF